MGDRCRHHRHRVRWRSRAQTSINLRSDAEPPSVHDPFGRARALGLSTPAELRPGSNQHCAGEVTRAGHPYIPAPVVCFPDRDEAERYISGNSRPQSIRLSGTGGTAASSTSYKISTNRSLGYTCQYTTCDMDNSAHLHWYTTFATGSCTHAYPADDFYVSDTGVYQRIYVASDANSQSYVPNCNAEGLYPGTYENGAGARLATQYAGTGGYYWYVNPDGTYFRWASMSWHNR